MGVHALIRQLAAVALAAAVLALIGCEKEQKIETPKGLKPPPTSEQRQGG